uniref:Uncharacterized protein n=1 Tax=Haptolina brevifila TaxID=156173 RepID=A0A7S2C9W0_9EUKA
MLGLFGSGGGNGTLSPVVEEVVGDPSASGAASDGVCHTVGGTTGDSKGPTLELPRLLRQLSVQSMDTTSSTTNPSPGATTSSPGLPPASPSLSSTFTGAPAAGASLDLRTGALPEQLSQAPLDASAATTASSTAASQSGSCVSSSSGPLPEHAEYQTSYRAALPQRVQQLAVEVSGKDLKRPSPKRMLSAGSREMALPDAKHRAGYEEHGEEDDDVDDDDEEEEAMNEL